METPRAKNWQPATWRGATPYHADTDRMGVFFDLPDGQVIRLAISRESAAHLVGSIMDYLPGIGSQSLMSSDIPSVEGSTTPGQSQCPPERSSSAACGET